MTSDLVTGHQPFKNFNYLQLVLKYKNTAGIAFFIAFRLLF